MKPQILRDLRFLFSLVVAMVSPLLFSWVTGHYVLLCVWALPDLRLLRWDGGLIPPISTTRSRLSRGVVVAPRATGRPGAGGPGRCVCRWAAVFLLVAPTDLRPPRGLPARSPSTPRASLGASARSPARPRRRPRAPQPGPLLPVGVMGVSRVEFLGCSGACCYKRRQSKVFFVWLSAALLRTSSIQGVFRVDF